MFKEIVAALMIWASNNTGLPITEPPTVRQLELRFIQQDMNKDTLAFYDENSKTIYIGKELNIDNPVDKSILLHEIVHHLQFVSGKYYMCKNDMEYSAYNAQTAFLAEHGIDPEKIGLYNSFKVLNVSRCPME